MTGVQKFFLSIYLEKFKCSYDITQSALPILLFNGLMMVANEGSIAGKYFRQGYIGGNSL